MSHSLHPSDLPARPVGAMGRRWVLLVLTLLIGGVVTLNGCSQETRYRVLSMLFEAVPKPGEDNGGKPVVRRPRRPRESKPSPPSVVVAPTHLPPGPEKPGALREWTDVLLQFPKDASGGVDWVRALEQKIIEPRAGVNGEAPHPVFALDVKRTPEGQPFFEVTFSHKAHTEWLTCVNCHPRIFQMKRGAAPITMAGIYAGQYCGRCHGKVSFAVPTGCPRCHQAMLVKGQ